MVSSTMNDETTVLGMEKDTPFFFLFSWQRCSSLLASLDSFE